MINQVTLGRDNDVLIYLSVLITQLTAETFEKRLK